MSDISRGVGNLTGGKIGRSDAENRAIEDAQRRQQAAAEAGQRADVAAEFEKEKFEKYAAPMLERNVQTQGLLQDLLQGALPLGKYGEAGRDVSQLLGQRFTGKEPIIERGIVDAPALVGQDQSLIGQAQKAAMSPFENILRRSEFATSMAQPYGGGLQGSRARGILSQMAGAGAQAGLAEQQRQAQNVYQQQLQDRSNLFQQLLGRQSDIYKQKVVGRENVASDFFRLLGLSAGMPIQQSDYTQALLAERPVAPGMPNTSSQWGMQQTLGAMGSMFPGLGG